MRTLLLLFSQLVFLSVTSCATQVQSTDSNAPTRYAGNRFDVDYSARLPKFLNTGGKKTVLVDPNVHAWGAYDAHGDLVRAGIATGGGATCPPDADKASCYTKKFVLPIGGKGDNGYRIDHDCLQPIATEFYI